jgi:hypothetical protein
VFEIPIHGGSRNRPGAPADYRKALKEARAAVKALGKDSTAVRIQDLRAHDLRRTFGS